MTTAYSDKKMYQRLEAVAVGEFVPKDVGPYWGQQVIAKAPAGVYLGRLNKAGMVDHNHLHFVRTI